MNSVRWGLKIAGLSVLVSWSAFAGAPPVQDGLLAAGPEEEGAAARLAKAKITVRGNDLPLGTVLNQIARSARLALVIDKDVRVDTRLSAVDLDGTALDAALAVLLTPLGYSFAVDPERNFLRVFVYAVSTFKVSMPVVVQNWSTAISNGDPGGGAAGASGSGGLGARIALATRSDTNGLWEEVEKSLGRLLGTEQSNAPKEGQPIRPELGTFSVNRVAGFVTVRALPSVMPTVESYFQALEQEMGRSVTIEIKVMQVDLINDRAGGVDWNLAAVTLGPLVLQGGSALAGTASNQIFNGQTAGAQVPFVRISGRAGDAFVRALEQQGTVKVLAQPNMALGNNLPAILELAEIRSYVDQITTTLVANSGAQTSVRTATVSNGLMISMMPRVLEHGEVSIAVGLIMQEVLGIETFAFAGGAVQLPSTARRSYSGVIRTKLNETLVMGGLISTRKEDRSKGLPLLAKIPILGILFGQKEGVDRRSELILTVTPREIQMVGAQPSPPRLEPLPVE